MSEFLVFLLKPRVKQGTKGEKSESFFKKTPDLTNECQIGEQINYSSAGFSVFFGATFFGAFLAAAATTWILPSLSSSAFSSLTSG